MTNTNAIAIHWQATLPELLRLLVEHGAEALLAAPDFSAHSGHARALLEGQRTIYSTERHLYGDESVWEAWDRLLLEHGERLRQIVDSLKAAERESNARRVEEQLGSLGEPPDET